MRDGAVCGDEAFGYMMAHREDRDTRTAISMEEAEKSVSKRLTVTGRGVAVIPTDGKNEVLCYEFVTETPDGRHILVYVNANTGVEEMLQILIETEQGHAYSPTLRPNRTSRGADSSAPRFLCFTLFFI